MIIKSLLNFFYFLVIIYLIIEMTYIYLKNLILSNNNVLLIFEINLENCNYLKKVSIGSLTYEHIFFNKKLSFLIASKPIIFSKYYFNNYREKTHLSTHNKINKYKVTFISHYKGEKVKSNTYY